MQWYVGTDNTGTPAAVGSLAQPDQRYTAYLTFEPEEGYRFSSETRVSILSDNRDKNDIVVISEGKIIVQITFGPTIKNLGQAKGSLDYPKDGEILPDIAVTTEHVTGSVQWYEGSDDTGTPVTRAHEPKATRSIRHM